MQRRARESKFFEGRPAHIELTTVIPTLWGEVVS